MAEWAFTNLITRHDPICNLKSTKLCFKTKTDTTKMIKL